MMEFLLVKKWLILVLLQKIFNPCAGYIRYPFKKKPCAGYLGHLFGKIGT
jgi:hypothetical protein